MPAQPKNAEQPACDRCGLGNDRAIYLDVIDDVLEIIARLSADELQPQHEQGRVVGYSWDTETYYSRAGRWKGEDLAGGLSEIYPSIEAVPQRHGSEAVAGDINREADGHVLKETQCRNERDIKIGRVIRRTRPETKPTSIRVGVTRRNI